MVSVPELGTKETQPSSAILQAQTCVTSEHSYHYVKNMTHPITGKLDRYILGNHFHERSGGHEKPTCKFHNIDLCPELHDQSYQTVTSEVINSKIKSVRLQSSSQEPTSLLPLQQCNGLLEKHEDCKGTEGKTRKEC